MRQVMTRELGIGLLATILISGIVQGADPDAEHSFKLAIKANMEMTIQGKKQPIDADTVLGYTWSTEGDERTLSFDSLRVKVINDGMQLLNTQMDREKVANTQDGKTEEVMFDAAPEELKAMLRDSFDTPICRIQVDAKRKELKRTVVAGPGAKDLTDQGMIANALFFHPPFQDKAEFTAANEISMGNGGFAKGNLTYKKVPGGKGGQAFKVSGTLGNDSFTPAGSPLTIKKAKYVVTGEQVYDPKLREWISGKLSIKTSFDMTSNDAVFATAAGTMELTFRRVEEEE